MKFVIYSIIAVVAIVAAVIAFRLSDQTPVEQQTVQGAPVKEINVRTVDVLVARNNIPVGAILDNSMIDRQPWPENLVLEGFVTSDQTGPDNIVGKVVRSAIQAHEPFMKSKLANPNDPGFLAANLPPGMRAVTIASDVVSGVAGFIFPGDRVDILFTHAPITATAAGTGQPTFTEVLGSNIRVLAVNMRDVSDPNRPAPVTPTSLTLEVTDAQAQQIRLAEKSGTLSFTLRSIRDDGTNVPVPTDLTDLSTASVNTVSVVRGPGSATGGKIVSEDAGSSGRAINSPSVVTPGFPPDNSGAVGTPVNTAR